MQRERVFHRPTMRKPILGTERISLRPGQVRGVENGKAGAVEVEFGHEELCQSIVYSVIATLRCFSLTQQP